MSYNYSKLDGKIIEVFKKRYSFAKAMELSERSLSLKMTGKVPWKQKEISKACNILKIPYDEIPSYFFTLEVQ